MKYFATTLHREFEYDIIETDGGYELTDTYGKIIKAKIDIIDSNRYSILINNESFIVNSTKTGDKYTNIIRGKQIDVTVDDTKSKMWKDILIEQGVMGADSKIKAPMPGLIVKILVNKGQEIKQGDALFVLSAMKMENEIKSQYEGTVKDIFVNEGDVVEKSTLIIELA